MRRRSKWKPAGGSALPGLKAASPASGGHRLLASRFKPWGWGLLLAAATCLAYLPVWHAGFIWDDDAYVTRNATLNDWRGLAHIWFQVGAVPQYYPLVHTTFWVEHHLWGLHPLGYHLDNVLLHVAGALLLGCVLGRLQVPGAWLAAAIFALHPVQAESVAWVTERKNVLSGVFYLAAALAYLEFDPPGPREGSSRRSWGYYRVALVLFVAALLSKTVTCSLPAALLLVRWWKNRRVRAGDVWPLLPFFALGIGLGWLTAWMEKHQVGAHGAEWSLTFADRCLVAGRAVWFYAGKLIWPAPLIFIYPRWTINAGLWWQWLFPAAAAGVVAGLWGWRRRVGWGPMVGVLFFIGTLGPALGFVNVYPMRYSFVADHFQYLACIGPLTLVAALIEGRRKKEEGRSAESDPLPLIPLPSEGRGKRRAKGASRWPGGGEVLADGFAVAVLLVLGVLTWRQCGMYAEAETLWRVTLARNPDCEMAHINLGSLLTRQGELTEAVQQFNQALQLDPDDAEVHSNLGGALARLGKLREAIQSCDRALQLDPNDAQANNNLGFALAAQGKINDAIQHFQRALALKPDYADAHVNLGAELAAQAKWAEAIGHYERALEVNPDFAEARYNLGIALATQGKLNEAMPQFQQALQLAAAQGKTALAESIRAQLQPHPPSSSPSPTP